MPVGLEQWRASVGAINAGGTRVLARCLQRRGDRGFFRLFRFLLLMCFCIGVWLVVKWSVLLAILLRGCWRRCSCILVVGGVCVYLSTFAKHGGVLVSHDYSSSGRFSASSFLDGSGQSSNVAFHVAVMDTLLHLSGDVEKNPGPFQLFALVPSNAVKLLSLLTQYQVDVKALRMELGVPPLIYLGDVSSNMLYTWLSSYSPTWSKLGRALAAIGCGDLSGEIFRSQSVMERAVGEPTSYDTTVAGLWTGDINKVFQQTGIPRDPAQWTKEHTYLWAEWTVGEFNLYSVNLSMLRGVSGLDLCTWSQQFLVLGYVKEHGQTLHHCFERIKALGPGSKSPVHTSLAPTVVPTLQSLPQHRPAPQLQQPVDQWHYSRMSERVGLQLQQLQQQQFRPQLQIDMSWSGVMEFTETGQQIRCQFTSCDYNKVSFLMFRDWPVRIEMTSVPRSILNDPRMVFHEQTTVRVNFQDSIPNHLLQRLTTNDFGLVRLTGAPQCPIKAFKLCRDWIGRFVGEIPLEQGKFMSVVEELLLHHQQQQQLLDASQEMQRQQQQQQQQGFGMQYGMMQHQQLQQQIEPHQLSAQQGGAMIGEQLPQVPQQQSRDLPNPIHQLSHQISNDQVQNQPGAVSGDQPDRQAQKEKLLRFLLLLAKSSQQEQEQILQRMPYITAVQKQQLLERAQALKEKQTRLADLQAQEEAQHLLDEATKNGYVTSQSIVIVLVGIAGSGKSSFKRLVLNLPPEKDRISTPLAEAAIRNLSISRAVVGESDTVKWEVVDSEQLLQMVADAIKEVGVTQDRATPSLPPSDEPSSVHHSNSGTPKSQDQTGSNSPIVSESRNLASSVGTQDCTDDSTQQQQQQEEEKEFDSQDDRLLPLIRESKGSGRLLGVHWVYIIDTGGQPQFLQLLPAFIKNISSCVCLVRLDQGLDDKPLVKFFNKSGQQCGKSYPSEHTNLQLVESCVRTIHSRCCLQIEAPPNFFVVGTHRDEYEKCPHPETIEMKNERLTTLLSSLEQSLTFYKADDTGKLIFPLNCKTPESHDKAVAAEFRKCVMKHCPEPSSKIPLAWFILEERIRQYATKKNLAYVERDICLKIAKTLHMTNETFEVALNHLLKLNIFRSYSSLPNLIFCDTQVVLLKLTELVQHSFQLRESNIYCVKSEDISFKNEGIIDIDFLSRFPQFFSDTFTPKCFIHILRELLAIADLHNGRYFMPCLLKELSEKDFHTHRSSSKSLSTLLLYLDGGCLPNGLFTSLIASLKNDHQWALSKKKHKSACLFQNCVQFKIPAGLPGVVTLIASFSFIEVHLDCSIESIVDSACARVFSDIKSSLQASWNVLYPGAISFKLAFFCSSCAILSSDAPGSSSQESPSVIQSHHATVNDGGRFETCSHSDCLYTKLCDSKLRWLKNTGYYSICNIFDSMATSGENVQGSTLCNLLDDVGVDIDSSCSNFEPEIQSYLSKYELSSCPYLKERLDWDSEVESDLIEIANEIPEWEEKLVVQLKLTAVHVSDIKKRNRDSPGLQRREALQVWKSICGLSATYGHLLEICIAAKYDAGARAVCQVLQKKGPQGAPPSKKGKFQ